MLTLYTVVWTINFALGLMVSSPEDCLVHCTRADLAREYVLEVDANFPEWLMALCVRFCMGVGTS